MKIECVSLRECLKGKKRIDVVSKIISRSQSDVILFCGRTLINEKDICDLQERINNNHTFVVFEVSHIKESNYVKLDNGLFIIEDGQIKNLFSNQLFSTSKEIDGNEMLCERFINELKTRRTFKVGNMSCLIIQCGELNIIKNLQNRDNYPIFRHSQRTDLQVRFSNLLFKTNIILNPIHTPMGNQPKMEKRRKYLSSDKRYYFSTSQDGGVRINANTLQYAYHDGEIINEQFRDVTDDYQIRMYEIE